MGTDNITNITTLGFALAITLGALTLFLPRKYAIVPLILAACYMTLGQRFVIFTLDFTMFRVLIALGWMRLVLRNELIPIKLNKIDKAIILWVASGMLIYVLREQSISAITNRMGFTYNSLGLYFMFRFLIRDFDEVVGQLRLIAILIIPLAIAMLIENSTGRNFFSLFGGVPAISWVRDGSIRAQGPFSVAILAGIAGATLMPLMVPIWWGKRGGKKIAILGIIATTVIMVTSSSSGPLVAYAAGITGLYMWRFRYNMRAIRWGLIFSIISLHIVMTAPVWHVMTRLGNKIGGGGWHRAFLIDTAIAHFDEWWLLGSNYTAHWMAHTLPSNPNMADITNQFINEGVNGGLLTAIMFIVIIISCFKMLGRTLRAAEHKSFYFRLTVWSMGASLLAHLAAFISVAYFDQIIVFWYFLLAMISIITSMPVKSTTCGPVDNMGDDHSSQKNRSLA